MVSRLVLNLQEPSNGSVDNAEDSLPMTTVVTLDDVHLSMYADDPGCGQRGTGM